MFKMVAWLKQNKLTLLKNLKDEVKLDVVRIETLELLAKEIQKNNVKGSCAELGVYQGGFAQRINENFPDRKLYLFDTFQGFDKRDVKKEMEQRFSNGTQDFSGTSISMVMSGMRNRKNVIIKKGWFPKTAEGLNETFAFVSIDADLYQPIYAGLEYFYPRLEKGGYLMIHDYNNSVYKGAGQAVEEYCNQFGIGRVPIPDHSGSVIITK